MEFNLTKSDKQTDTKTDTINRRPVNQLTESDVGFISVFISERQSEILKKYLAECQESGRVQVD